MAIKFTYSSDGGPGQSAEFAKVVCRAGVCTSGVAGTLYELSAGQDPTPTLGHGPLAVADARAARLADAQRYCLKVEATTAGTISSVTQSGSGPTISVAGSAFDAISATPWIAAKVKIKVIRGGALGVARIAVALDGANYLYELDIPAESPATVLGTVDVTTLSLPSALDTLTLVLNYEGNLAQTCTFSAPGTPAAVVSQVDALSGAVADLVQGKYLRIRRPTVGTSSTLAVNASSTAEVLLGLATTQATGAASTVTLPGTGLVLTFASGTYVEGDTYTFTTTAPRCSLAAISAAITAALTADPAVRFGLFVPVQAPLDDADLRAYADALDALCQGWEAGDDRRYIVWLAGAPLDGTDAADKAAMLSHVSKHGAVATRDCYLVSAAPQPAGQLRASAVEQLAIRCVSQASFSDDVGFGGYGPLECLLRGPDGTLARNEATATVKLGGSKGAGFTVLTSKGGKAYFKRGVTRAGSTGPYARFVDLGVLRATKAVSQVLYDLLQAYENPTFDLNADGTIFEGDAAALEAAFKEPCDELFVRARHFSRFVVQIDRAEKISDTRALKVVWRAQIRGQGEDINGTLTVGGTLTDTE